jgi:methylamine utilization protein MauE
MTILSLFCRLTLIGVFALSAGAKLRPKPFEAFRGSLAGAGVISTVLSRALAVGITALELGTAAALCATDVPPLGFGFAIVTLVVLGAGVIAILVRHVEVTCNCFGSHGDRITRSHLVRIVALLVVALSGELLTAGDHSGELLSANGVVALAAAMSAAAYAARWDEATYVVCGLSQI